MGFFVLRDKPPDDQNGTGATIEAFSGSLAQLGEMRGIRSIERDKIAGSNFEQLQLARKGEDQDGPSIRTTSRKARQDGWRLRQTIEAFSGSLAQLVEQLTIKQLVDGYNPSRHNTI